MEQNGAAEQKNLSDKQLAAHYFEHSMELPQTYRSSLYCDFGVSSRKSSAENLQRD